MNATAIVTAVVLALGLTAGPASAGDDSMGRDDVKASQGAKQVERGARQVGAGVVDTAKGIGKTVVGGAEMVGKRLKAFFTGSSTGPTDHGTNDKEGAGS